MRNRARHRLRSERGSVLISGLLLTLALLMVLGTVVDLGHAFIVRRELASLADDAALSGSQAIDVNALHSGRLALNPGQARAAALDAITANPGVTGHATAGPATVTVRVQHRFPTILLRLVGLSSLTVSAHSTATPRRP